MNHLTLCDGSHPSSPSGLGCTSSHLERQQRPRRLTRGSFSRQSLSFQQRPSLRSVREMALFDAINILWDALTIALCLTLIAIYLLNKPLYNWATSSSTQETTRFWHAFGTLYVVPLLANYLSIPPLVWMTRSHCKEVQLKHASLLVGAVNWLLFVPAMAYLMVPFFAKNLLENKFVLWQEVIRLSTYLLMAEGWFYVVHRALHSNKFVFELVASCSSSPHHGSTCP